MKNLLKVSAIFLVLLGACKQAKQENNTQELSEDSVTYASFGDTISAAQTMSSEEMLAKFNTMQVGDTVSVKFKSSIKEVCTKKGCWMKLPLSEELETMVRFKDYGFFMPLDSQGKEVIVAGKAFVKITPVEELQHYAEDAGKSAAEIATITVPKKEFAFEANGVLIAETK